MYIAMWQRIIFFIVYVLRHYSHESNRTYRIFYHNFKRYDKLSILIHFGLLHMWIIADQFYCGLLRINMMRDLLALIH